MVDHASGQVKVLTVGPPCGRITDLLAKVTAINNKHGPFDVLFVLGDLFTPYVEGTTLAQQEIDLLNGTTKAPITIYFTAPPSPLHPLVEARLKECAALEIRAGDEEEDQKPIRITDTLHFLRSHSVSLIAVSDASSANAKAITLRVAVAGGRWDAQAWQESVGKEGDADEGNLNPWMTYASVERLLMHPSFQEPGQEPKKAPGHRDEPPTTLAAARAQMAQRAKEAEEQAAQVSKPPIDILLTAAWPNGITMFSDGNKLPHPSSRVWGAPIVAQLLRRGQPRYHFAVAPGSTGAPGEGAETNALDGIVGLDGTPEGRELQQSGVFWEREPFRVEGVPPHPLCNVSRFVSLARFGNAKKVRWFMALNLSATSSSASSKMPDNATPNPFFSSTPSRPEKRKDAVEGGDDFQSGQNFRWTENKRQNNKRGSNLNKNGLPNKPNVPLPDRFAAVAAVAPQDCWFCLSNPQCAKHLVAAIGTECYIAMPKGQLPSSTSDEDGKRSNVPGGGHVLIIPIEHFPSLLGHTDAEVATTVAAEAQAWRLALKKAFASFDAVPVAWEVCRTSRTRAGHMQTQVVPVARSRSAVLVDYFRQAARESEYDFIEDQAQVSQLLRISQSEKERQERSDYVRLDFNDVTWIMWLPQGKRFNLQFPRQTLAAYLGTPDRADWKKCARSEAIETAETQAFKAAFERYADEVSD